MSGYCVHTESQNTREDGDGWNQWISVFAEVFPSDVGKRKTMFFQRERHPSRQSLLTHLIGSVYFSGSPSSILHIVLLHLGTNFRTGSDVTCRLEEK